MHSNATLTALVADQDFVDFLVAERERRGFGSWEAFAESADVGSATVFRILKEEPDAGRGRTHIHSRNAFARALGGTDWFALVDRWRVKRGVPSSDNLANIGTIPLRNVELHRGLPASRFIEHEPGDERIEVPAVEGRSFTAVIVGDCMADEYPDGALVTFSYEPVESEGLRVGADYFVQQDGSKDAANTFKRLEHVAEDTYTFGCINAAAHPQKIIVDRRDVVRMARAVLVSRRV